VRKLVQGIAFWFDIAKAEVLAWDPGQRGFLPLDERQAERLAPPAGK
jgi:hypothetical protein